MAVGAVTKTTQTGASLPATAAVGGWGVVTGAWREVATRLRDGLADGTLCGDGRLPTQAALATLLRASRHAVRRALEALEEDGLIVGRQGRGAELAPSRLLYRIGPSTRFGESAAQAGRAWQNRVLAVRLRKRPAEIARLLNIRPGAPMVTITQLRMVDGAPACLGVHYFDPRRLPGVADALRRGDGVTAALRACGCPFYARESTRVEARRATAFEALTLEAPRSLPVLYTLGRNVDAAGSPVEITETVFRADCVSLVI